MSAFPSRRLNLTRVSAFTLIELLVVVAIVGLLAALLMPALANARKATKRIQCLANVRSIGQAMHLYLDDHHRRYPGSWLPGPNGGSPPRSYDFIGIAGTSPMWSTPPEKRVLNPYVGIGNATNTSADHLLKVARCPFDRGASSQHGHLKLGTSYVYYDRQYEEIRSKQNVIWEGAWAIEGHNESEITMPSLKMVIADVVVQASGDLRGWHDTAAEKQPSNVSMAFADGHAAFVARRTGTDNFFKHGAARAEIERLASIAASYY